MNSFDQKTVQKNSDAEKITKLQEENYQNVIKTHIVVFHQKEDVNAFVTKVMQEME